MTVALLAAVGVGGARAIRRRGAGPTASRALDAPAPPVAPAAWRPDPTGGHELRYWDGVRWTANVSDRGVTGIDPIA